MMKRPLLAVPLLLALAVTAGAQGVGREIVQATDGDAGLYALAEGGATRIERLDGGGRVLEMTPGAQLYELEALDGGWVATAGVWTREGHEMVVLRERGGALETLPPAPGRGAALRGAAVPLIDAGRLVGLAWMEGAGPETLEVRAAVWTGAGWGPCELVSLPERGSQVALAGVVLAGGDWLLVWAGVDGHDDEVMWSRRGARGWSPPRRVHPDNGVPDITPALVAHEGGALVAWSWFDGGDYRLKLARFEGDGWSPAESFGERGSLEPSFHRFAGRPWLLYRTVSPATWALRDLGPRGGRATVAGESEERPLVLRGDPEAARLRWPAPADGSRPAREAPARWEEGR